MVLNVMDLTIRGRGERSNPGGMSSRLSDLNRCLSVIVGEVVEAGVYQVL
jgi:hypothetical protein